MSTTGFDETLFNVSDNGQGEILMKPEGYVVAACVLFLIGFFGFFLNFFVIVLVWREKQLWTPLNMILLNLVCSDFLVSVLGNPWTFMSALSHRWIFGRTMCKMYGFIMALLGITSISTLTVLAFERYLMICQPLRNFNLNTKGAYFLIGGIWMYSALLTTPPLLGWGDYVNEAADISCSVNWEERSYNAMTYIVYLFVFGLFLPVIVITFSYISIIVTMKKNTLRAGRVTKAEGRVTCMIFIMIIAFMVAWTPYATVALVVQFGDPSSITAEMAVAPALLAKSSICYNPIIYVGLNSQFRQTWKHIFCKGSNTSMARNETTYASKFVTRATTQESTYEIQGKLIDRRKYELALPEDELLEQDQRGAVVIESREEQFFVVVDDIRSGKSDEKTCEMSAL